MFWLQLQVKMIPAVPRFAPRSLPWRLARSTSGSTAWSVAGQSFRGGCWIPYPSTPGLYHSSMAPQCLMLWILCYTMWFSLKNCVPMHPQNWVMFKSKPSIFIHFLGQWLESKPTKTPLAGCWLPDSSTATGKFWLGNGLGMFKSLRGARKSTNNVYSRPHLYIVFKYICVAYDVQTECVYVCLYTCMHS